MKKKLKWIAILCGTVFLLLQLFNPPRTNPPAKSDMIAGTSPPAAVAVMLTTSCYDCHSYKTKWPWYSKIAPVSMLVADDVSEGRQNLNLSEWPADQPDRAARRLEDMGDEIGYKTMPPKKYTAIHADARLTDAQRKILSDWLYAEADKLKSSEK